MSAEGKLERLKKVTGLFDQYVNHISEVRGSIETESQFVEGYAACLTDILEALAENKDTEILRTIKTKISMETRKEVLDELRDGLLNLRNAYTNILNEE
jgi:cell division protein ZapA (FtsZ GTPase activity inhibitor)